MISNLVVFCQRGHPVNERHDCNCQTEMTKHRIYRYSELALMCNTMCSFQCLNLKHQGDGFRFRYSISEWKQIGRPKTRRNPVHLEYVKFLNPEPKLYYHTTFPKTWFSGQWLLYLQDLVFVEYLLDGTLNLYQAVLQSAALASQVQVLKPLFWWSTIGFILY